MWFSGVLGRQMRGQIQCGLGELGPWKHGLYIHGDVSVCFGVCHHLLMFYQPLLISPTHLTPLLHSEHSANPSLIHSVHSLWILWPVGAK